MALYLGNSQKLIIKFQNSVCYLKSPLPICLNNNDKTAALGFAQLGKMILSFNEDNVYDETAILGLAQLGQMIIG